MRKCWWRGEEKNCSDLFDVRKTDDGFCCSFNTLDQSQNLDISLVVESTNNAASNFANNLIGIFGGIFDTDYEDEALTTSPQPPQPSIQAVLADSTTSRTLDGSLKKGLDILSSLSRRNKRQAEDVFVTEKIKFNENETATEVNDEEELLDIGSFDGQKALQKLKRSNSASYLLGLSVLLDAKSDNYYVSPENYVGFKVMAHHPTTFPEVGSKGTILDGGKEAFFGVSALYTESSSLVRSLEVEKITKLKNIDQLSQVERRNCIFADERDVPNASITVFKFYSQVTTENALQN